jgi:hypothetical protein
MLVRPDPRCGTGQHTHPGRTGQQREHDLLAVVVRCCLSDQSQLTVGNHARSGLYESC